MIVGGSRIAYYLAEMLTEHNVSVKIIEKNFLEALSLDIEKDLRTQIHAAFIEGLFSTNPEDLNLRNVMKTQKFRLLDKIIDSEKYKTIKNYELDKYQYNYHNYKKD